MLIDPAELQSVAVQKGNCIPMRMSLDDPTLTYEEVMLYLMCRYSNGYNFIDPDRNFAGWKREGHLDREWLELSASKTHPMEIVHPWDEIFPEYKRRMEGREIPESIK